VATGSSAVFGDFDGDGRRDVTIGDSGARSKAHPAGQSLVERVEQTDDAYGQAREVSGATRPPGHVTRDPPRTYCRRVWRGPSAVAGAEYKQRRGVWPASYSGCAADRTWRTASCTP
jgi:hypothetical protein